MNMKKTLGLLLAMVMSLPAMSAGTWVQTPYKPAKIVFEFYLDDPSKLGGALFWIRSVMSTMMDAPYSFTPEDLSIKVVIHGTEIVTVAKKNEAKYQELVDRMRYYADIGVEFKVCGLAAEDFGYSAKDFQDFIHVVPNAMTELAHWQQQGYALIFPHIYEKRFAIEEIR